jgi:kinesin family protein C2/C3
MFVHISPDADSFGETMSTLKFAERVATVELGAARSNKESGEIQILKDQVHRPGPVDLIRFSRFR